MRAIKNGYDNEFDIYMHIDYISFSEPTVFQHTSLSSSTLLLICKQKEILQVDDPIIDRHVPN